MTAAIAYVHRHVAADAIIRRQSHAALTRTTHSTKKRPRSRQLSDIMPDKPSVCSEMLLPLIFQHDCRKWPLDKYRRLMKSQIRSSLGHDLTAISAHRHRRWGATVKTSHRIRSGFQTGCCIWVLIHAWRWFRAPRAKDRFTALRVIADPTSLREPHCGSIGNGRQRPPLLCRPCWL